MKNFKGKAIYQPAGKAGEYSYWACNFYVGCSHGCTYCYCKKGILAKAMGQDKPQLKKCFKNEKHALEIFEKELKFNLSELRKHGLFFSFTTDPMLEETVTMTLEAVKVCCAHNVPVKILTKATKYIFLFLANLLESDWSKIVFGFTLTGRDDLEPGASTNLERIEAAFKLKKAGFKIFFSIEPIIDFESSLKMILKSLEFCDLYKIGLESGKKYDISELKIFYYSCIHYISEYNSKIYFKDSFLKSAGIERNELPENCVGRDYNLFE